MVVVGLVFKLNTAYVAQWLDPRLGFSGFETATRQTSPENIAQLIIAMDNILHLRNCSFILHFVLLCFACSVC